MEERVEKIRRNGGDIGLQEEFLDICMAKIKEIIKPPTLSERVGALGGNALIELFDFVEKKFLVSEQGKEEALRTIFMNSPKEEAQPN